MSQCIPEIVPAPVPTSSSSKAAKTDDDPQNKIMPKSTKLVQMVGTENLNIVTGQGSLIVE